MPRRRRYTYFEYRLLVSPKVRGQKLAFKATEDLLDEIVKTASKLKLEVVGGCYPYTAKAAKSGKGAKEGKMRRVSPKLFRVSPGAAKRGNELPDLFD